MSSSNLQTIEQKDDDSQKPDSLPPESGDRKREKNESLEAADQSSAKIHDISSAIHKRIIPEGVDLSQWGGANLDREFLDELKSYGFSKNEIEKLHIIRGKIRGSAFYQKEADHRELTQALKTALGDDLKYLYSMLAKFRTNAGKDLPGLSTQELDMEFMDKLGVRFIDLERQRERVDELIINKFGYRDNIRKQQLFKLIVKHNPDITLLNRLAVFVRRIYSTYDRKPEIFGDDHFDNLAFGIIEDCLANKKIITLPIQNLMTDFIARTRLTDPRPLISLYPLYENDAGKFKQVLDSLEQLIQRWGTNTRELMIMIQNLHPLYHNNLASFQKWVDRTAGILQHQPTHYRSSDVIESEERAKAEVLRTIKPFNLGGNHDFSKIMENLEPTDAETLGNKLMDEATHFMDLYYYGKESEGLKEYYDSFLRGLYEGQSVYIIPAAPGQTHPRLDLQKLEGLIKVFHEASKVTYDGYYQRDGSYIRDIEKYITKNTSGNLTLEQIQHFYRDLRAETIKEHDQKLGRPASNDTAK